jgi:hypothetical protein
MPSGVWLCGDSWWKKLNMDEENWTNNGGSFGSFADEFSLGAFWSGAKSIAEDRPPGGGKDQTSVFVVSCGEFW